MSDDQPSEPQTDEELEAEARANVFRDPQRYLPQFAAAQYLAEKLQNPLYAWDTIAYCKKYDIPVPEWCHAAILKWGEDVAALIDQVREGTTTPDQAIKCAVRALGFAKSDAGRNAFEGLKSAEKHIADAKWEEAEQLGVPISALAIVKKTRSIGEDGEDRTARRRIARGRELYAGIKQARARAFATLDAQADTNGVPKESGQ